MLGQALLRLQQRTYLYPLSLKCSCPFSLAECPVILPLLVQAIVCLFVCVCLFVVEFGTFRPELDIACPFRQPTPLSGLSIPIRPPALSITDTLPPSSGDLQAVLREDRSGTEVPVHITDHGDGTLRGEVVYPRPGTYTLHVQYGGRLVPQSPAKVTVQPGVDVSQIRVEGLEPSEWSGSTETETGC